MRLWTISNTIEINAVTRVTYNEPINLDTLAKYDDGSMFLDEDDDGNTTVI